MKIGFVSLGCPKNLVDSEVMLGLAEQAGHEITTEADGADVLVVNSCAFIDRAKQESIDTILEMAELKKQAAGRRLIVTGCLGERYRDELKHEIPEIDVLLGTGEVPEIVAALGEAEPPATIARAGTSGAPVRPMALYRSADAVPGARPALNHTAPVLERPLPAALPTYLYDASTPRLLTTPRHYAYIKVAEGCDYKCAFCIIPQLRGKYRSRTEESSSTKPACWHRVGSRNCS